MFADRLRKIWTKVENLPGEILTCPSCLHSGLARVAVVNSFDKMRYPLESKSAYYKCAKCGVMYLEPRPTLQELRSAYQSYYTHDESFCVAPAGASRLRRLKTFLNPFAPKALLAKELRYANHAASRVLDLGCGSGRFLLQSKHDYPFIDVYGVDFDPDSFYVSNYPGGFVGSLSDFLESNPSLAGSFSLITLHHSIEHLTGLHDDIDAARQLLSDDGTIYIETPNNASLSLSLLKQDWLACDPPRHLFIFSLESLIALLAMHGLTIVGKGFYAAACTAIIPLSVADHREDSTRFSLWLHRLPLLRKIVTFFVFVLSVMVPPYSDFVYVKARKSRSS